MLTRLPKSMMHIRIPQRNFARLASAVSSSATSPCPFRLASPVVPRRSYVATRSHSAAFARLFSNPASDASPAGPLPLVQSPTDPSVSYTPIMSGGPNPLPQTSFFRRFANHGTAPAIYSDGRAFTYADILRAAAVLRVQMQEAWGIPEPSDSASDAVHAAASGSGGAQAQQKTVAVLAEPSFEYVAAVMAAWSLGAAAVPLHPAHPAPEMEYILSDSGCIGVLSTATLASRAAEIAPGMVTAVPEGKRVLTMPEFAPGPETTEAIEKAAGQLERGELSALRTSDPLPSPLPCPPLSSAAFFIYTSGTTGRPKGVPVRHSSLLSQLTSQATAWAWAPSDCIKNVLPLHHVHGLVNVVLTSLWVGARLTFDPKGSRFDARAQWNEWVAGAALKAAARGDPRAPALAASVGATVPSCDAAAAAASVFGTSTLFMAVPTIYDKLIHTSPSPSDAAEACRPLRMMASGSMALPTSTLARWRELSAHTLLERYGMTEIGMALTNPIDPLMRKVGAVGKPFPGVEVRVKIDAATADEDEEGDDGAGATGSSLGHRRRSAAAAAAAAADATGVIAGPGELLVRGASVFSAYWHRDEATAEAFETIPAALDSYAEGPYAAASAAAIAAAAETDSADAGELWFRTGDIVSVDADGDIKILGRASVDILKVSGFKISALDVERELLEHPSIAEVAVLGLPSQAYGQTIAAIVVLTPEAAAAAGAGGQGLALGELRDWAESRMAHYKVPRALWVVGEIPRNAMGKVNKKQLAKIFPKELAPSA